MIIYGINPVLEALKAGRVIAVRVSRRGGPRVQEITERAARAGIAVRTVDPAALDREVRGGVHQGVVADVRRPKEASLSDLVASVSGSPLLVVLDGIEDPQNVGAILRTADAAGVDAVVRQTRHAARLDGAVAKASAGALSHLRIVDVVNIARALEALKGAGVWSVGLSAEDPRPLYEVDLTGPVALVFGAESTGLRRLVRETCDLTASILMQGHVQSLNVSVAAGIALFEAVRQRSAKV